MLYVHVLFHTCTYNIFTITQVPVQLDILFALNKKREGVYVSFLTTPTCNIINENTSTCVYIIQEVDLCVLFSSLRSQPLSMKKNVNPLSKTLQFIGMLYVTYQTSHFNMAVCFLSSWSDLCGVT